MRYYTQATQAGRPANLFGAGCLLYSMSKQNWHHAQKYAINKKSTIFTQFWLHFAKMISSLDRHFDKVP